MGFASSLRSKAVVPAYTITDLGTLGGSPNQSHGYGINNCGTTVGDSLPTGGTPFVHPFYKKGVTMTDVGTLGSGDGSGFSINSFGYVVGYSTSSVGQRAILWHDNDDDGVSDPGELQDFLPAGAIGVAYDINDNNRVVGLMDASGGSSLSDSPFVWDGPTNTFLPFTPPAGLTPTRVLGINNAGTIAGWANVSVPPFAPVHAFVLKNSTYIDLGTLDNTTPSLLSFAWRISEDGHVVGYSQTPSNNASQPIHPFMWFDTNSNNISDAGEMKDLHTLSGGTNAYGYDINASGYVVGTSEVTGGGTHAYVWHDDDGNGVDTPGEMKDLNTQFSDATWSTLVEARSINDGGQIIGWGTKSNGETHAFLLTPTGFTPPACPTPSVSPSPTPTPATTSLTNISGVGTYGGTATLTATLTSNSNPVSGKTINFTVNSNSVGSASTNGSGVASLAGVSLTGINGGSYPNAVGASFAGDSSFASSNGSGTLTVNPANQAITVNTHAPANATYNAQFTVAATASSGLAVTYTSSGSCTNNGATFTMTSGTGTCNVMFNQAGNSNYNAASQITETVTAQKANQTITINTHAPANAAYNSQFTVAATASSSLAISYSSSGVCTNTGATFTITSGSGTCTAKYDQAGDTNFNAASQITENVTAQKATATITLSNLTQVFDGSPKFATASTTPPGLTVNITYSQNGNPVSSPTSLGAYAVSAVISDSNYQGSTTGTLNIVEPAPVILLEAGTNNAAAVDSVTFVRGPFRVTDPFNFSSDHITRIIIFTAPLASPDSTLTVSVPGHPPLQIENFGMVTGVPGLNASYIVVKLDPVLTGSGPIAYDLTVSLRNVTSNTATLTIIP